MTYTATYSPEDNKLRLYASGRLDAETYERVRAAGFRWAPKQELFVAPTWTPGREDLLVELAGEVGDEDTTLVERAEAKADRLEDLAERRTGEAVAAKAAVDRIADGIPFGQPILIGHHSEKRARKDAEKIRNGMGRAVKLWEEAGYWTDRAAGALRLAKYKERPDVRARRIKKLEAELRKVEKNKREYDANLAAWTKVKAETDPEQQKKMALYLAHYGWLIMPKKETDRPDWKDGPTIYGALTGEHPNLYGPRTVQEVIDHALHVYAGTGGMLRWIAHLENRLTYERAMLGEAGGIPATQNKLEKGGAIKGPWQARHRDCWLFITKVNKVSVSFNYWPIGWAQPRTCAGKCPFDKIAGIMTKHEIEAARAEGRLMAEDEYGFVLGPDRNVAAPEPVQRQDNAAPERRQAQEFEALRQQAKQGVQVVVAPQLFPTPTELANWMVELAKLEDGDHVLEPSAGTGALMTAAAQVAGIVIHAVEKNQALALALMRAWPDAHIWSHDFLDLIPENIGGQVDVVLMNPPFDRGADIAHIKHALGFVRPGGRLVAICANGPRQRAELMDMAEHWEDLPDDTFAQAGTRVRTALLVIRAPR